MYLTDDFDELIQTDQQFCIEMKLEQLNKQTEDIFEKLGAFGQPALSTVDSLTNEYLDMMLELTDEFGTLIGELLEHQAILCGETYIKNKAVNY